MKKRFCVLLGTAIFTAVLLSACTSGKEGKKADAGKLYVYNWGEYIDEGLVEEFEAETGIDVIYDLFETNEEMYPVIETGARKYDVVCPSDYMVQKMMENDLLAEIDMSKLENISNIGRKYMDFTKTFDPENKYIVPYNWGTVGIIYNTSMVDKAPTSWADLWNEKYKGNILMQDSVRDAFMVGQKLLGYSMNGTDETELKAVRDKLIEQKPLVQAYVVDQVRDKMIGGEAALAVIYSGEVMYIKNEIAESGNDWELKYVLPSEGTNVWLDGWVIPKNAENKENALKWIDFMLRPEIAKRNFEYITYPTPNEEAFKLLDKELQNDTEVFPTDDMLVNTEIYKYLGSEVDEVYNELWKEVKSK